MEPKPGTEPMPEMALMPEIVEKARWAAARISKRAKAAAQARELVPETVRDLHESGLLTMVAPKDQGGTEADLVTLVAV